MNSTEEKKFKKFHITGLLTVIMWTLICILFIWDFGDDKERFKTAERLSDARQRALALERKHENEQNLKIRSHDERLKVFETAVVDLLTANPNQPAIRQDESANNAEAVSDEDFRAMVLKNAKINERMAVVRHFRQEDEFKKSLKPHKKRKFDDEVEKAYENLLAECKIAKDSLDKWQENALRQSVETAVILEWRLDDYSNQQVETVSEEERQEKLEKLRHLDDQLAELAGEIGSE